MQRAPVPCVPRPDPGVLAEVMHVEDAMDDNSPPIDTRPRAAFGGHEASALVEGSGTIGDAVNLPAARLIAPETGRILPPASLRDRAAKITAATPPGRRVVVSDTGIQAAPVWFALREILGFETVRIYDGSLAE